MQARSEVYINYGYGQAQASGAAFLPGLMAACCVACAAMLLFAGRGGFSRVSELTVVWLTALMTLALAVGQVRIEQADGKNPWASALSLTAVFYFYRYGFGALVVYYWDRIPWEVSAMQLRFLQQDARLNLTSACQMIMLGSVGFALGFLLPCKAITRIFPRVRWAIDKPAFQRRFVTWAFFAPAALLLSARYEGSVQVLAVILGSTTYFLTFIAAYWFFTAEDRSERLKWGLVVTILCLLASPAGLVSGQMGQVVAPPLMITFGFMAARARLPWKTLAVVALIALLLIFPFLTVYKSAVYDRGLGEFDERLAYTRAAMDGLGHRVSVELALDRFVARMATTAMPATYSGFYPNPYPYDMGRSFLVEISTFIPRFVWPEKPSMSAELNRYGAMIGLVREGGTTSAVFDAISEYYVNFGLLGVFALSLLHGAYLKVVTIWISSRFDGVVAAALNFAVFFSNPEFFGLGQVVVGHSRMIPIWLLLLYFLSRRGSQRNTQPALA